MRYTIFSAVALALITLLAMDASPSYGHGQTDQRVIGDLRVTYQIQYHQAIGQSFVPSEGMLSGVTLGLQSFNPGSDTITVHIRSGSITGPIVGSTSKFVPEYQKRLSLYLEHFDFPVPLSITPGSIYVIEVNATNPSHAWSTTNDIYGDGQSIVFGQPSVFDFIFETCSPKPGNGCKTKTVEVDPGMRGHGPTPCRPPRCIIDF